MLTWSIPAGRIFGIRIRIHFTLLGLFLIRLIDAFQAFGLQGAWVGAVFALLLYATVLLHELGHCFAGAHVGGDPDEVLLWPLGGLATIDGVPRRPGPQILVALGGPAVNVVLAGALAAAFALAGHADVVPGALPFFRGGPLPAGWGWFFAEYALGMNLGLLLFNLLPAFPLDGGQAARWALTPRLGFSRATRLVTGLGYVLAVGLVIASFRWSQPMLVFLAIFIWVFCRWERAALEAEIGFPEADVFGYDFSQGYTSLDERAPRGPGPLRRWLERLRAKRRERDMARELEIRRRVDDLLVKIGEGGLGSLTDGEKAFLKDASKRYRA